MFQKEPAAASSSSVKKEPKQEAKLEPTNPAQVDAKPLYTIDWNTLECTWHRYGTAVAIVKLKSGPEHFLIADFTAFGGDVHHTDYPDLMLYGVVAAETKKRPAASAAAGQPVLKKPSAVLKKPGAALPPAAAEAAQPAAPAAQPPIPDPVPDPAPAASSVKDDYGIMYYKNGHSIRIRRKFGDKSQAFSFGGVNARHKSEAELRDIAKQIVDDLHEGISVGVCKQKGQNLATS